MNIPGWWGSDRSYKMIDCMQGLKEIPSGSVDLILTDPPYGTNDGRGKTIRRGDGGDVSFGEEWDTILPTEYIARVATVLKDDRWGVIFTDKRAVSRIWDMLEVSHLTPRNTFYWIKTNKVPTPRANFKSCVEVAVVFTRGRTNRRWRGGGNMPNYIEMPFVNDPVHPTQKPVELFRHLIELFTEPGDIVLDPFLGSGTTLLAARTSQRIGLGFEIDCVYEEVIHKRSMCDISRLEDFD